MTIEEDELIAPRSTRTLNAVSKKAAHARDIALDIIELEERLRQRKAELKDIMRIDLPNLMDEAATDRIGIPAQGNFPAYDLRLSPFYNANIAASWAPERKAAAFAALTELGHQDLIKTEVTVLLPREARDSAQRLLTTLKEQGFTPATRETVHFKTLTAWLQEQYEHGNPLPPLDVIGAEVGRIVRMIERKT